MFLGVKVVLAKSFQRIHMNNLVNFGILPLTFRNEADYEKIEQNDELDIAGAAEAISAGRPLALVNRTRGAEIVVLYSLTDRQRRIVLAGGLLSMQRRKTESGADEVHG